MLNNRKMGTYTLDFQEIGSAQIAVAGGKGANLGELARIGEIQVPDGFCITTDAFDEVISGAEIGGLLERLANVKMGDKQAIMPKSMLRKPGSISGVNA